MTDDEFLAQRFEEHRAHLRGVAYRMLGSASEAEDAVQEAWLRLDRADADEIDNMRSWLTTVVARVSLNALRARRTRREEPLGAEVYEPDPIISPPEGLDPEQEALLADSVGLALLVVLETLTPAERLCISLCHGAGMSHGEAAEALQAPLGTVKSHVKRGLDKLKARLAPGTEAGKARSTTDG